LGRERANCFARAGDSKGGAMFASRRTSEPGRLQVSINHRWT
jgi:hypothetical protein